MADPDISCSFHRYVGYLISTFFYVLSILFLLSCLFACFSLKLKLSMVSNPKANWSPPGLHETNFQYRSANAPVRHNR